VLPQGFLKGFFRVPIIPPIPKPKKKVMRIRKALEALASQKRNLTAMGWAFWKAKISNRKRRIIRIHILTGIKPPLFLMLF
jgi:hypothetical protein